MPVSRSCITELPIEIIEQIILYLPGQDIIGTEAISQRFRDLAHSSSILRYRRELFAAGLMDNPYNPCDLAERQRLCKEYVRKWSDATNIAKCLRDVPLEYPISDWSVKIPGRNLLVTVPDPNGIDFTHIPPAISRKPIERWSIRQLPSEVLCYATYPPKNILAVAKKEQTSIRIDLLNLLDGSPYRVAPSNIITWAHPRGFDSLQIRDLVMTASRLMIRVYVGTISPVYKTVVWDWETGDLVFKRSSADGSGLVRHNYQVAFLDEFRIMVTYYNDSPSGFEIFVFNTLVPQGHPRNLRRFKLPPKYRNQSAHIHLDRDRSLGTVNRDGPLIIDPAQAILILELSPPFQEPESLLILRMQCLIELVCSMHTDIQIPWDEWGSGSVAMEIPATVQMGGIRLIAIHGARMLVIRGVSDTSEPRIIHVFDFSRRGSTTLPLSDGSDDGIERGVAFEDGRSCAFEGVGWMGSWGLRSSGDSVVAYAAPLSNDSFGALRVLDLM